MKSNKFPRPSEYRGLRVSLFTGALLVLFCLVGEVHTQVTFTGPGFTIVDGTGRNPASCSTIAVAGVTANSNVRSISLNSAAHSWLGDLEVRIYPPGVVAPPSTAGTGVVASPPDGRPCNLAGSYRIIDTAAQSIDAATSGCADATDLPSGDYRSSTYGGGTSDGPVTTLSATFGVLTPAQANGNWLVCVFDFAGTNGGSVGSTAIEFVSPSAARVTIGGRVATAGGRGIGGVVMTMSDPLGNPKIAITNPFGFYRFDEVEVGLSYAINASSKLYTFESPTIIHLALEDSDGLNFVANP